MKGCFKFIVLGVLTLVVLGFLMDAVQTPKQSDTKEKVASTADESPKEPSLPGNDKVEITAQRKTEALKQRQAKALTLQQAYLQELVAIEGVESAAFADLTHLKVRLKPLMHQGEDHVREMCENIAKGWAARCGLTPVVCEEWYGEKIYATGEYTGPVPEAYLARVIEETVKDQKEKDAAALVAMEGKTFADIEGTHGRVLSKNKDTGWAEWPKFRARFVNGKVAEVSVK